MEAEPTSIGTSIKKFIPELEGLRGLLALWVFVFHALRVSGLHIPLLSEGNLAVQVFIILSGFMIGRLRILKHESYSKYIIRRIARIYPAYLIALVIGILISGLASITYASLPWDVEDISGMINRHYLEQKHFLTMLITHLTLIQGIFPEEIIKAGSVSFLGVAWSLSLEWQFYLVAPVLIALLTSKKWQSVSIIGILIIALATPHILSHFSYTYKVPSFLPMMLTYFVVGIITALLFDSLTQLQSRITIYGLGIFICCLISAASSWTHPIIPFVIWFLAVSSAAKPKAYEFKYISLLLTCKPVEFLGRVSYGFYIYHAGIYIMTVAIMLRIDVLNKVEMFLGILCIALPITLLIAALSYYFIEIPIMHYVKNYNRKVINT